MSRQNIIETIMDEIRTDRYYTDTYDENSDYRDIRDYADKVKDNLENLLYGLSL